MNATKRRPVHVCDVGQPLLVWGCRREVVRQCVGCDLACLLARGRLEPAGLRATRSGAESVPVNRSRWALRSQCGDACTLRRAQGGRGGACTARWVARMRWAVLFVFGFTLVPGCRCVPGFRLVPSGGGCRSNRQTGPHAVGQHVFAAAALDDFAALHHQVLIGQLGGEVVVLLDQHDGHLRLTA